MEALLVFRSKVRLSVCDHVRPHLHRSVLPFLFFTMSPHILTDCFLIIEHGSQEMDHSNLPGKSRIEEFFMELFH